MTGDPEARVIATRPGPPPKGFANGTRQVVADRVVEPRIVPAIRTRTVRRTLKKTP